MNKEKLAKLEKYLQDMTARLQAAISEKHTTHPESYKFYLNKEISTTKAQIERLKNG